MVGFPYNPIFTARLRSLCMQSSYSVHNYIESKHESMMNVSGLYGNLTRDFLFKPSYECF